MSGLETLGAIVNIAQLCSYLHHTILSIRATLEYLKTLPQSIKKRAQYLDSLASVIDTISITPRLRTHTTKALLESIRTDIDLVRDTLIASLRKATGPPLKRLWRIHCGKSRLEANIAGAFASLEQNKSSLQLYFMATSTITMQPNDEHLAKTPDGVRDTAKHRRERLEAQPGSDGDAVRKTADCGGADVGQRTSRGDLLNSNLAPKPSNTKDARVWGKITQTGSNSTAGYGDKYENVDQEAFFKNKRDNDKRKWDDINSWGDGHNHRSGDEIKFASTQTSCSPERTEGSEGSSMCTDL
ncbi:MAG: hypothetical protein M1820_009894 [Bogoriella megaspora]|nr:MAG: hypothetical protein M1820_009894 [Bogoriella megaspora]